MKLLRYNFNDIYKLSNYYESKAKGTVILLTHLYRRDWQKFFEHNRSKLLDTTRWTNYIINFENVLSSELTTTQKAVIIKLAGYREYSDYMIYGDRSIHIDRVKDIPLDYIEDIPLIEIKNDKINLIFEEN